MTADPHNARFSHGRQGSGRSLAINPIPNRTGWNRRLAVIVSALPIFGVAWVCQAPWTTPETEAAVEDWIADSRFDILGAESPAHAEWVRNFGPEEREEYVASCSLREIAKEFPVHAGMTIGEMDAAIADNKRRFRAAGTMDEKKQMYNLGWEQRRISAGNGWVYYWANFEHLFYCDIVIESGRVRSVWVMPGNREVVTGVFYCISGSGLHTGPGRSTLP